ncbi:hypothetical protein EZV62_024344 [Acer yangbiense]|uniref:Membrane protein of ER body-like protein n=1 Tax=Acer yangbiense TaxID=1000413 RepID=A0A5C7GVC2_9ROSI|nr:hypothetical protein EZV62_024344 [Acer yangbiense]
MEDMEAQEQPWQEEEVEEDATLLGRQARQHHNNPSNNEAEEKTEKNGAEEKTEENGHNKSVYFETHQGIWKCRHCYWTYRPSLDLRGNGSAHQYNATDSSYVSDANYTDEELNLKTNKFEISSIETNNGNQKHLENESLSGLSLVTVQKVHDKNINNLEDLQNTPQGDAEVDLIEEIDNEFTDLDVERVLQKQNTHDLYCPNCNSCITTRVVLRRRRRRVRNICYKTKLGNNLETPTELDASYQGFDEHNVSPNGTRPTPPASDHNNIGQCNVSPNGTPTPPAIDHNNNTQNGTPAPPAIDHNNDTQNGTPTPPAVDRNTEIFRCLSCFSLFVPTGQTLPGQTQPGQTLPGQTQLGQTQPGNMQPVRTIESSNWDILKSIVYGGLVESITSLGVVSSAAGAGATTFLQLKELKNDHSEETSNQINVQEGRYQRLLGQEQNFSRHAVVVILSFLIFGLLPPVIYGFSFRKSDDRDLKIAAVAGSSFVCIVLLAVAKGHVQKPPRSYFRTVLYYVSLGVAASGISYVVGDLFEKLMEKLGLFVSSKEVMMPFLEMDLMNTNMKQPEWSSF